METIGERVEILMKTLNLTTIREFGMSVGKGSSTLSMIMSGANRNPTYEVLSGILNAYPQVNPEWLMTGHGPILRNNGSEVQNIGKRILMICELEGISRQEFAERVGKSESYINNIITAKTTKVANDLLLDIQDTFPNVRLKWFMYGNGEPLFAHKKSFKTELGDQIVEVIISLVPKG